MLDSLLAFLLPIPEFGSTYDYTGYTAVPADAPIRIDECEGSLDIGRGLASASNLQYGTAFTVTGLKTARRVVIRFAFEDRHFTPVYMADEPIAGTFTPDAKVMRTHRYGGGFHEHRSVHGVDIVVCSPLEVDFTDGSAWRAPSYAPQAIPSGGTLPHPQPQPSAPPAHATPVADPD